MIKLLATQSHAHTKHQTRPNTGWCPNVTNKKKKTEWLGQVKQPVDSISLKSQQTRVKNDCEMKKTYSIMGPV